MALVLRPPSSRESLADQLAVIGRTRKTVALAGGLFALCAAVLGCVALACAIDVGFHLPPLARALALAATLAVAGVFWLRGVGRALALKTDALSIALELEDQYPALNDVLASAVSFLNGPGAEARGVSNRLEAAVVRSARRFAERHEFSQLLPGGSCWRAIWAAVIVVAAVVPLVLVNSGRAATALVRFADPFGTHPWPTKTRVEMLVPTEFPVRIPKGEPFELKFAVRGVIKDRATVSFRMAGDEFEEHYPLAVGNDQRYSTAAVVAAKIDPSRLPGSFAFRVSSNDHDTGWLRVEVVPPPRLMPLDGRHTPQFRVDPPAYTGLPPAELPDGAVVLEFPVGTAVRMRAATDVRLASASLTFLSDRSAIDRAAPLAALGHLNPFAAAGSTTLAESMADEIPLSLDATGRLMTASFRPVMSGMYALKMTDETGLTGNRLIEIRLAQDPAPIVTLLRPALGRDPSFLTPTASVGVLVAADDKLYGVRRTFLEYRVGRDGAMRTIALNDRRGNGASQSAVGGVTIVAARPTSSLIEARRLVPVTEFVRENGSPIRDGDTLYLRGAADDWDDVTPCKEPGRSEGEVEIRIASAEAIEAWLQHELARMRPDLVRVREQEREARQRTADVAPMADGTLTPADRDRLLSVEHLQRQIRGKIGDPRDGLHAHAESLRETARANRLPKSNTTDRVERVADELARLSERDLPVIEPGLAEARQFGGQPARTGQEQVVPDLLKRAERHQKAVEDGLTNLLDLLAVWGGASEIRGEARVMRDHVNRLAGEVDKLNERVPPGTPAQNLSPQQRAEIDRAAAKTEQAAERAGALLSNADKLAGAREATAAAALGFAAAHDILAGMLGLAAEKREPGDTARSGLNAQANVLKSDAEDLRAAANKSFGEAGALRKGIQNAGGQSLSDELRKAADALRSNRQTEAATLQRSAAGRLDRLADALAEKESDAAPDLKKWKRAADDINALADAQDELRTRAADAAKVADPARRETELKRLAVEQERLIDRGKSIVQRLTRERAETAARNTRAALDHMETARDQLENGNPAIRAQNDAVDRLDAARDRLDAAAANPTQQLSDEKRRKMAETVKALAERQKAAVAEAERIHKLVAAKKGWERPVLQSYKGLEDVERELAVDLRELAEKQFAPLPVLARLLNEASTATDSAAEKMKIRREDALDADPSAAFTSELEAANDRKVARPMALAARRLEQLLDVLKPDEPKVSPKKEAGPKTPPEPKTPMTPPQGGNADRDVVPPLAQLKVLKALQAELNLLTAEFAKAHPDPDKLSEDEREELKELEQSQRDIAALFEQMAELFNEHKQPKPDKPEPEKLP